MGSIPDTVKGIARALGMAPSSLREHFQSSPWIPRGVVRWNGSRWKIRPGGGARIVKAYRDYRPYMQRAPLDPEIAEIRRQMELLKLEQMRIRTREMERKIAFDRGDILPRDEYEIYCAEVLRLIRDRQLSIPKQLASLLPNDQQASFIEEGTRLMVHIINQGVETLIARARGSAENR